MFPFAGNMVWGGNNPRGDFRIPDKKKEAPVENKKQTRDLGGIFRQMPPLPDEWVRRLGAERGWSEEVIRKHDLRLQVLYKAKNGPIKNITWKLNKLVIPIHDESGKIVNMWIYRPGPATNENDPKIFSWEFGTGEARLFPAKPEADGFILLCEGEPDLFARFHTALTPSPRQASQRNGARSILSISGTGMLSSLLMLTLRVRNTPLNLPLLLWSRWREA